MIHRKTELSAVPYMEPYSSTRFPYLESYGSIKLYKTVSIMENEGSVDAIVLQNESHQIALTESCTDKSAPDKNAQVKSAPDKSAQTKAPQTKAPQTKPPQTKPPQTKAPILHSHKRPSQKRPFYTVISAPMQNVLLIL